MPVDFPDMSSLIRRAEMWKFRLPYVGEYEYDYRVELAKFVLPKDRIEAFEILFGKGWDKWNDMEKMMSLVGVIK